MTLEGCPLRPSWDLARPPPEKMLLARGDVGMGFSQQALSPLVGWEGRLGEKRSCS